MGWSLASSKRCSLRYNLDGMGKRLWLHGATRM